MPAFDERPIRLDILFRISAMLKDITIANGFDFDLTDLPDGRKRVMRGRAFLGEDDPDTLVTVLEPPNVIEQLFGNGSNAARFGEWDILIQGWTRDQRGDEFEPCDLTYFLANNVQQKLLSEKKRGAATGRKNRDYLGHNEITDILVGAPAVRPTTEISGYGVFYLILTLKLVEGAA